MYVGLLDQHSEVLVHRHMTTDPEACLNALAPSRPGMVVAVACLCTGYGLADLGADDGSPVVLEPALSLQALPGGQGTNDTSDAQQMAARR
jgi:hypothetical protein